MKKRVLFLCSQNKLRSPTAAAIFADHPSIEVDSAGLNNDAEVPLSEEQIEWADLILVMEQAHRNRLNRKFKASLAGKRVAVLGIPDDYDFMDPALVTLLKKRCACYLADQQRLRPPWQRDCGCGSVGANPNNSA